MRKLFLICSLLCLLGNISLQAKEYTIKEIPMVHLQDRTRYVSNPDGILSESAVATMDQILYQLEQNTGIQTLVVAVTGIEGGDCFDFAYRLGKEMEWVRKNVTMAWSSSFLPTSDASSLLLDTGWKESCPMPSASASRADTW